MMEKRRNRFTVRVTGGNAVPEKKPEVASQQVAVDIRNGKVRAITCTSEEQEKTIQLFKDLKAESKSLGEANVSKALLLEIKRIFMECTTDTHLDVDANQYLDSILFDSLRDIIFKFILHVNKDNDESIKNIINQSIANTVSLLDYQEVFDYNKMKWTIDTFIEVFK